MARAPTEATETTDGAAGPGGAMTSAAGEAWPIHGTADGAVAPPPDAAHDPAHASDAAVRRLELGLTAALGVPFTAGNAVDIHRNGRQIFPAMLDAIRGARKRIEFLTFVYWTGEVADRFVDALTERAQAGVEVLVILDSFGARSMQMELRERLVRAGVHVRWFRPLSSWRVWQISNRTHRKVLIVDGETGFTGGVGIAAEWEGDGDRPDNWRDTHFRIRGPAVAGLTGAFYEDWFEADGTLAPALALPPVTEPAGNVRAQVVSSPGTVRFGPVARLHRALLLLAERRIRIATPYFSITRDTLYLMREALERGVELEIMIPGPYIDKRVSELAVSHHLGPLIKAGAHILRFQPSMLHLKLMTVDGVLASIGSANFNARSRARDQEVVMTMLDPPLVAALDADFDNDTARCRRLDMRAWRRRSRLRRAVERVTRPIRSET